MKSLLIIIAVVIPYSGFSQGSRFVEVKDFRPVRDSIQLKKKLPNGVNLTAKYICRNFDFCIPIPNKSWLTSRLPDEKPVLSPRNDKQQLIIERDPLGRMASQVYYSCVECLKDSYGYIFSYDSSGNEVTLVQLSAEDIQVLKQGLKLNKPDGQNHTTTFISYNAGGFIQRLTSSSGNDLLFSITLFE